MPGILNLEDARRLTGIAVAESRRRGVRTAVAVVDSRGDPIVVARVDGARSYYPDVALGKAMAAALWQSDTRAIGREPGIASVQARVNQMHGGRVVYATGGVLLRREGEIVGAIGVGGSGPDSDEEIARVAVAALDG